MPSRHRSARALPAAAVAAALALVACTPIRPGWDPASQGDLAARRTFSLQAASEPAEPSSEWQQRRQRVRALILTELTAKGYRHSVSPPDFDVRFLAGPATGSDAERRGELEIRAVDPASGRLLWRGWANGGLARPLDDDRHLRRAVREILAEFPPAS